MKPVPLTVLPVPTFLSEKVAEPPVSEISAAPSPTAWPVSERVAIVATLLPLYCLLEAVKLPVTVRGAIETVGPIQVGPYLRSERLLLVERAAWGEPHHEK